MWFIMIYNHLKADHVQPKTPLFTSGSQHPPRFDHAVYLGEFAKVLEEFCHRGLRTTKAQTSLRIGAV